MGAHPNISLPPDSPLLIFNSVYLYDALYVSIRWLYVSIRWLYVSIRCSIRIYTMAILIFIQTFIQTLAYLLTPFDSIDSRTFVSSRLQTHSNVSKHNYSQTIALVSFSSQSKSCERMIHQLKKYHSLNIYTSKLRCQYHHHKKYSNFKRFFIFFYYLCKH